MEFQKKGTTYGKEVQLYSYEHVSWHAPEKQRCGHLPGLIRDAYKASAWSSSSPMLLQQETTVAIVYVVE